MLPGQILFCLKLNSPGPPPGHQGGQLPGMCSKEQLCDAWFTAFICGLRFKCFIYISLFLATPFWLVFFFSTGFGGKPKPSWKPRSFSRPTPPPPVGQIKLGMAEKFRCGGPLFFCKRVNLFNNIVSCGSSGKTTFGYKNSMLSLQSAGPPSPRCPSVAFSCGRRLIADRVSFRLQGQLRQISLEMDIFGGPEPWALGMPLLSTRVLPCSLF